MRARFCLRCCGVLAMLACCFAIQSAWGADAGQAAPGSVYSGVPAGLNGPPAGQPPQAQPPYRLADRIDPLKQPIAQLVPGQPNEHPLMPALRWAQEGLAGIKAIRDYSATVEKQERLSSGKLNDCEYMFVKIRQQPFSVYVYFLAPGGVRGREVIWVEGQNNGKMIAHTTGLQDSMLGNLSLDPNGMIAMQGERYPLTEIGLANLVQKLVDVAQQDVQYGECKVDFFKGAKINNRVCTCLQVVHPVPRRNFRFHFGADLRRRRAQPADPLRVVRLAQGARRHARADRKVHLSQSQA